MVEQPSAFPKLLRRRMRAIAHSPPTLRLCDEVAYIIENVSDDLSDHGDVELCLRAYYANQSKWPVETADPMLPWRLTQLCCCTRLDRATVELVLTYQFWFLKENGVIDEQGHVSAYWMDLQGKV